MRKRWAVCAALAAMVLACNVRAQEVSGTLKKIRDSGAIMLGLQTESVPFAYKGPDGKIIGYSVELCQRIAEGLKAQLSLAALEVKSRPLVSAARVPLLTGNAVDLVCGSMSHTVEREAQVSFTYSHFFSRVRTVVRKDSAARTLKELAGERVVLATGTTAVRLIHIYERSNEVKFDKQYAGNFSQAFSALQEGKAAAFVMDDILISGLIAQNRAQNSYRILEESLHEEPYAIAMRRDPAFKQAVDGILAGLMKNGDVEKLYARWFMSTIPPGLNLQVPASAALLAAFANPTDKGVKEP
jgi:glutamate/aspartate transport system substrate-binding protein